MAASNRSPKGGRGRLPGGGWKPVPGHVALFLTLLVECCAADLAAATGAARENPEHCAAIGEPGGDSCVFDPASLPTTGLVGMVEKPGVAGSGSRDTALPTGSRALPSRWATPWHARVEKLASQRLLAHAQLYAAAAVEADPKSPASWELLARAHHADKKPWMAVAALALAAELDPKLGAALSQLLDSYQDLLQPPEMEDVYQRLADLRRQREPTGQLLASTNPNSPSIPSTPKSREDGNNAQSGLPQRGPGSLHQPPRPPEVGRQVYLFGTPLYTVNLVDEGRLTAEQCSQLSDHAIKRFGEFLREMRPPPAGADKGRINSMYFRAQSRRYDDGVPGFTRPEMLRAGTSDPDLAAMPAHAELIRQVHLAVDAFVAGNPGFNVDSYSPVPSPAEASQQNASRHRNRSLVGWNSVQRKGGKQGGHCHADTAVTIVFYARVPPEQSRAGGGGGGSLVLDDPRAYAAMAGVAEHPHAEEQPKPPFAGNRFHHHPRAGDLVVFPGWLRHSVEKARVAGPRVSFPFNLQGYWSWTAASQVLAVHPD